MTTMEWAEDADEHYNEAQLDQSRWPVLDSVDTVLADIVADHQGHRLQRFPAKPDPLWGETLPTSEGNWLVLWFHDPATDVVNVVYAGPTPVNW